MSTSTDHYKPLTTLTAADGERRRGEFVRHDGARVVVSVQQSLNVYWVRVNVPSGGFEIAGRVTKHRIGVWGIGTREVGNTDFGRIPVGWTFSGKLVEAVERVANEYLNNIAGAYQAAERDRRFDTHRVDTRIVKERLEAAGHRVYRTSSDNDDIEIYLDANQRALVITPDGDVTFTGWDSTGGVAAEIPVLQADPTTTLDSVVHETLLFLKRYDLEQRVNSLLEHLNTEVPSGVAHYAVEDAKKALQTLQRTAYTIDLLYGKEVPV